MRSSDILEAPEECGVAETEDAAGGEAEDEAGHESANEQLRILHEDFWIFFHIQWECTNKF